MKAPHLPDQKSPRRATSFPGSAAYWEGRYAQGRNSGAGSYGRLAEFKARILNELVERWSIQSVAELGCGDGNQLSLARYPDYLGFDISETAIELCQQRFAGDRTKRFALMKDVIGAKAELAISLDVIFHLTENEVYENYMQALFSTATRYAVIYSSNHEPVAPTGPHVRHRKSTDWVKAMEKDYALIKHIPNEYSWSKGSGDDTSFSDFYLFARADVFDCRQLSG